MNTIRIIVVAVVAGLTGLPAAASAQERVALPPTSGINVHEGYLQATGDLFRGHLQATGRYQVMVVPGPSGTQELSAQQAIEVGRGAGTELVAVMHITRLGSSAKVRVALYDVTSGQLLRLEQMSAATPDDVDVVTRRLAQALATGESVEEAAQIDTVTERESDPYLKMTATSVFGLKLGGAVPLGTTDSGENALPGLGIFWLYDARTFLAEVDIGFHNRDDDGAFYLGLGAYYPLSKANTTPFFGGAVRWAEGVGGDGSGIQLAAVGGMLLGRLSTVQLRGDVQYFVNTFESRDRYHATATAPDEAVAHGFLFNVGIGF